MSGRKPAGWQVDLSLVAVALIWGTTFILVKQALAEVSTLLFLTLRFAIATLALSLIFRKEFRRAEPREHRAQSGCSLGLFLFGGYVLQTFGLQVHVSIEGRIHHRAIHSTGTDPRRPDLRRNCRDLAELVGVRSHSSVWR